MQNGRIRIIARQGHRRPPERPHADQLPPVLPPAFPPGLVQPRTLASAIITSSPEPASAKAMEAKPGLAELPVAPLADGTPANHAPADDRPATGAGGRSTKKSAKQRAAVARRRKQHSTSRKGTAPTRRQAVAKVTQPDTPGPVETPPPAIEQDAFVLPVAVAQPLPPVALAIPAAEPALALPTTAEPLVAATPPRPAVVREMSSPVARNTSLAAPPRGLIAAISAWLQSASRLASFGLLRRKRQPLPRALQRVPSGTAPVWARTSDSAELARLRAENRRLRSQLEAMAITHGGAGGGMATEPAPTAPDAVAATGD